MADTRVVCSGAMAQIVALSRDVAKLTAQLESAGVQGDVPETPNPRGKATVRALFSVDWLHRTRMVGSDGAMFAGGFLGSASRIDRESEAPTRAADGSCRPASRAGGEGSRGGGGGGGAFAGGCVVHARCGLGGGGGRAGVLLGGEEVSAMQPTVLTSSSSCHSGHIHPRASSHSVPAAWSSSAHACGFNGRRRSGSRVPCSACRAACSRMFSTCVMALPVLSKQRMVTHSHSSAVKTHTKFLDIFVRQVL